jgi:hypothetical protein
MTGLTRAAVQDAPEAVSESERSAIGFLADRLPLFG